MLRQPIVVVLGHVDHGKTTLLDTIRGTIVAEREPGKITQHIGATEIPKHIIEKESADLLERFGFKLSIPGVLFIDTPGHEAFVNLRRRGGSNADLALLVVDINQGIQHQTIESIEILKKYRTPFIIALTKIDTLTNWISKKGSFIDNMKKQSKEAIVELDEKLYSVVGKMFELGFTSERFDNCSDFRKQVALVPCSGKTGEGIPELLVLIAGLSQKFMSKKLEISQEEAFGVVLETKEDFGLGKTIDVILLAGTLAVNDVIVVGGRNGIIKTKVRALLKPKPLNEISDKRAAFTSVKKVSAACGIKIAAPNLDDALAGSPLLLASAKNADKIIEGEIESVIVKNKKGVIVKANALGSLEALVSMLNSRRIMVGSADIGTITKKDVVEAASVKESMPLEAVILGFSVDVDCYAQEEADKLNIKIFKGDVIYTLIEEYLKWRIEKEAEIKMEQNKKIVWPAKVQVLSRYVFRKKDPAIFGVKVLAGRIKRNIELMNENGKIVGKITSIQCDKKDIDEALANQEVAIAVEGGVVGRNIKEDSVLYSVISKRDLFMLKEFDLNAEEHGVLAEINEISKKLLNC
ncbi:MAG: translation initiation factor IF-2 [Candidatus Diapherotrites archaeon]|nr:translation initiation factor IF-2 [Candidatus Diapherotrites archaeon]